ncbi:MAG: flagellar assembly protein FliW [Sulfuricellaceae bacterium]|nr:flagellar assembly protein FliW [Sulfuricellaceae bacterium]
MKIESPLFGEVNTNPETVITFPKGLMGFENCTRYQFLHEAAAGEKTGGAMVHYLQSLDDPAVCFSVVDPVSFGLNYEFTLTDDEESVLQSGGADNPGGLAVLLMVYKPRADEATAPGVSANINGPLVINAEKRLGLQKIIRSSHYDVTLRES